MTYRIMTNPDQRLDHVKSMFDAFQTTIVQAKVDPDVVVSAVINLLAWFISRSWPNPIDQAVALEELTGLAQQAIFTNQATHGRS